MGNDYKSNEQLIADDYPTYMALTHFDIRETLKKGLADRGVLHGFAESRLDFEIWLNKMPGALHQIDNGEYRLSPYQFKASDGRVVAELKDNGHFVTYREDGSVLKERNRLDVCLDMCTGNWSFGRLSTLTKSDDKDLMFY